MKSAHCKYKISHLAAVAALSGFNLCGFKSDTLNKISCNNTVVKVHCGSNWFCCHGYNCSYIAIYIYTVATQGCKFVYKVELNKYYWCIYKVSSCIHTIIIKYLWSLIICACMCVYIAKRLCLRVHSYVNMYIYK